MLGMLVHLIDKFTPQATEAEIEEINKRTIEITLLKEEIAVADRLAKQGEWCDCTGEYYSDIADRLREELKKL